MTVPRLLILLMLASVFTTARAGEPTKAFSDAAAAYDAGNFAEAERHYLDVLKAGLAAPELFFNMGNTSFKQGKLGVAVLNYRRAWTLSPRDPEVSANLRFTMQQAGATDPDTALSTHLASRFSRGEWSALAVSLYWISAALFAGMLFSSRKRLLLRNAAIAAGLGALVSLGGVFFWLDRSSVPEAVVIAQGQQALFAPLEKSTPHFAVSEGSIVRVEEKSGNWLRIRLGESVGWIPKSACEEVYAWKYKHDA